MMNLPLRRIKGGRLQERASPRKSSALRGVNIAASTTPRRQVFFLQQRSVPVALTATRLSSPTKDLAIQKHVERSRCCTALWCKYVKKLLSPWKPRSVRAKVREAEPRQQQQGDRAQFDGFGVRARLLCC